MNARLCAVPAGAPAGVWLERPITRPEASSTNAYDAPPCATCRSSWAEVTRGPEKPWEASRLAALKATRSSASTSDAATVVRWT